MHKNDTQNSNEEFTVWDFDYDLQDLRDQQNYDRIRSLVFDLPARPGTRR